MSRDALPLLPGGYTVGEKVFFTGASQTFPSGNKLVHGQQGEVMGPASGDDGDKRVNVFFPGNMGNISCLLSEVRLWRAATAGRLHGGREGVLHGVEPDHVERRQARARPAG